MSKKFGPILVSQTIGNTEYGGLSPELAPTVISNFYNQLHAASEKI